MIDFLTEGKNLCVRVKYDKEIGNWTLTATVDKGREVNAELTVHRFQKELEKKLKKIREDACQDGWKNAKAKRSKQSWFAGW